MLFQGQLQSMTDTVKKGKVLVAELCWTLCDPMDFSLPGSSIFGILQAGILQWVAIPFSKGSSWPRDQTWVSHIAGRLFTIWATRESQLIQTDIYKFWHSVPTLDNSKEVIHTPELPMHLLFTEISHFLLFPMSVGPTDSIQTTWTVGFFRACFLENPNSVSSHLT